MPQNPQDFAEEMPEWSRWKHEILLEYLGAFAGILQRYHTVYFIDGFAGAGQYEDGSEGSALRSAKLAGSIRYAKSRNYNLHCINIEQDPGVYTQLERNTANYSEFVSNYSGSFADNVNAILGEIAEQPALFFIDPFGFTGVEWHNLLPIFKRQVGITEFLICFHAPYVRRYQGGIGQDTPQTETMVNTLINLYGVENEEELKKCLALTDKSYEGVTEAYQIRLRQYFDYAVRIPIQVTEENGRLKYYLVFAARHEKAISKMNNAMYKMSDMRSQEVYQKSVESRAGQLSFLDDANLRKDQNEYKTLDELNTLKEVILENIKPGETVSRLELVKRVAISGDYLGAFSDSHFTAVLGGRPRKIDYPRDEFTSLEDDGFIERSGPASDSKTQIMRIN